MNVWFERDLGSSQASSALTSSTILKVPRCSTIASESSWIPTSARRCDSLGEEAPIALAAHWNAGALLHSSGSLKTHPSGLPRLDAPHPARPPSIVRNG